MKKFCFVIMGYGPKTDPSSGKTFNLDKTYENIIRPTVKEQGFECIRSDEIRDSSVIDKNMYALLMHADLVIADVSTWNPNAIYELGVRHAVKPFSTIIMSEKGSTLPFDLNHNRSLIYSHLGDDIGVDEANRCRKVLGEIIEKIEKCSEIDSPLYTYIGGIDPPKLPPEAYENLIHCLADKEKHVFAMVEKAKKYKAENNFSRAREQWEKICKKVPNEAYFTQQHALAIYKSKEPTELSSLLEALSVIKTLNPDDETNDPETLGLTGAIYKRMWLLDHNLEHLVQAQKYYKRGFHIRGDYYTGENFALCSDMMARECTDEMEKIFHSIAAKKAREDIISSLNIIMRKEEFDKRLDKHWIYATLSKCNYGLGKDDIGNKYESKFFGLEPEIWEINSFMENKDQLLKLQP